MTILYLVNNAIATSVSTIVYNLKELAKTAGWAVPSSGDGTTYGPSSDVIASPASLATNAWFRLRRPVGLQELLFIAGTTPNYTVRMSRVGFTGGSPSASVAPTATDQVTVLSNQSFGPSGANTRWNVVADNASPYSLASFAWPSGGGTPNHGFAFMGLTSVSPSDPDPFAVYAFRQDLGTLWRTTSMATLGAFYRGGLTRQQGSIITVAGAFHNATGTVAVPSGLPANPYTTLPDLFDILILGNLVGAAWPGNFKGVSKFIRWNGPSLTLGDTISTAGAGSKDRIVVGDCNFPWDGSTPTI